MLLVLTSAVLYIYCCFLLTFTETIAVFIRPSFSVCDAAASSCVVSVYVCCATHLFAHKYTYISQQ